MQSWIMTIEEEGLARARLWLAATETFCDPFVGHGPLMGGHDGFKQMNSNRCEFGEVTWSLPTGYLCVHTWYTHVDVLN